jgi:hypothetical protein
LNALRTELSRGLYAYLKDLLDCSRIIWSKIPDWLAPEYAKQQVEIPIDRGGERLPDKYRANEIIALILTQQTAQRDRRRSLSAAASEIMALKDYGDLRLKSGRPIEAIKIYTDGSDIPDRS